MESNLSEIAWVEWLPLLPVAAIFSLFVSFDAILWMNYLLCKMEQYFFDLHIWYSCGTTNECVTFIWRRRRWKFSQERNGWLLLVPWTQLTIIQHIYFSYIFFFYSLINFFRLNFRSFDIVVVVFYFECFHHFKLECLCATHFAVC